MPICANRQQKKNPENNSEKFRNAVSEIYYVTLGALSPIFSWNAIKNMHIEKVDYAEKDQLAIG